MNTALLPQSVYTIKNQRIFLCGGADCSARSLVLCVMPLKFDQLVRQSLREQPPYYTNRSIDL